MAVEEYNRHPQAGAPEVQPTRPGAGVQKQPEPTVARQPGTVAEAAQKFASGSEAQGGPGNEAF